MSFHRFILMCALGLSLAAAGCAPSASHAQPQQSDQPARCVNDEYNFSIVPPTGWRIAASGLLWFMNFHGPSDDGFTVNFNVTAHRDDGTPMDQAGPRIRKILARVLRDYEFIEDGLTDVDNKIVYWASGLFTWDSRRLRSLQYFFRAGNGFVFCITFASPVTTFAMHRPVFESTAQTVRVP